MNSEPSFRQALFAWIDRLLPPGVKEDPLLHLRVQVGLFMIIPGTIVSITLLLAAAYLTNDGNQWMLFPFLIGHLLLWFSAALILKGNHARTGLSFISFASTAMVIYSSYLTGGFGNVTMAWFVAIPLLVSMFSGRVAAIAASGLCLCALLGFLVLEQAGHVFPHFIPQASWMWATVIGWCLITTGSIAIFSHARFERTVKAYQSEIARRTKIEQTLRRAQQRLRIAKGAAEAGSSAKGAFLAQVSHEIRNPLTAIMGAIDLLELPADPKVRQARIGLLRRSSSALLNLVDDVLDFSKIESGRIEINPIAIDPVEIAEDIERTYRPIAHERGIELYLELDANTPRRVQMDPIRVRQVLVNMMSNALKFTTEGSITIEVGAGETEYGLEGITFGIEDTGIGIPDEAHTQIFEPYMQAERSTTEEYGGTGLGLSICSRLVSLMGGQLGFESEVGEGTRFWFTLPADMEANTSEDMRVQTSSQPGNVHVLVVEDDPLNRQVVGDLLRSLGHTVRLASTGAAGLAMYIEDQPDLVLMDIQMPELNGMQASVKIRAWENEHQALRVPILAMTADVEVHRVARYGEAGMNDLLGKPISREKLENAVKGWAVQHQA